MKKLIIPLPDCRRPNITVCLLLDAHITQFNDHDTGKHHHTQPYHHDDDGYPNQVRFNPASLICADGIFTVPAGASYQNLDTFNTI